MKSFITDFLSKWVLQQTPQSAMYSEATVQHKLGIELFKHYKVEPVLEVKIPAHNEYLDVYFRLGSSKYGIELKYKTKRVRGNGFEYANHGAQNNGRYDFLNDVCRLERFKEKGVIDVGYAVFVTNDPYYQQAPRNTSKVAAFSLASGAILAGAYEARWKGRPKPLQIKGPHTVQWLQGKAADGSIPFYAMVVEI